MQFGRETLWIGLDVDNSLHPRGEDQPRALMARIGGGVEDAVLNRYSNTCRRKQRLHLSVSGPAELEEAQHASASQRLPDILHLGLSIQDAKEGQALEQLAEHAFAQLVR